MVRERDIILLQGEEQKLTSVGLELGGEGYEMR